MRVSGDNDENPSPNQQYDQAEQQPYVLAADDGTATATSDPQHHFPDVPKSFSTTDGLEVWGVQTPQRTPLTWMRTLAGFFVTSKLFQQTIIWLIVLNAALMGIGTFDFVTENPTVSRAFDRLDDAFLIVFTIELLFQLVHHGWHLFDDGWLTFDFILILSSWALQSLQVIRMFRILRAVRLIARSKDLKNVVNALVNVLPSLFAIAVLLLLVFYIFAVLFTEMFKSLYKDGLTSADYFGRLDLTLFSLFEIMTGNWSDIAREVMETYSWAWLPFITFIMLSSFTVINLIIAVICDAFGNLHQGEIESQMKDLRITSAPSVDEAERLDRLEKKMEELSSKVDTMVISQMKLHDMLKARGAE